MSLSSEDFVSILAVAVNAARAAGGLILLARGSVGTAVESTKSGFQDLVTLTDKACEDAIGAIISAAFPSHVILGEESIAPGREASKAAVDAISDAEWVWVIDPIDGTTNFVSGIPLSCVSIGVALRGTVVVAVIYEPYRDELFSAIRGEGAKLNGAPIHVALVDGMRNALFGFGTHNNPLMGHAMIRAAGGFVDTARGLRALGSAAIALAYVSCGRLGAFFEIDLSSWDLAAGSLIVVEAGGKITDTKGGEYTLRTRDILASCGGATIHEEALIILKNAASNSSDDIYVAAKTLL